MSAPGTSSRWIPPAALVAVGLVALAIVMSGGDDDVATEPARTGQSQPRGPKAYVVKEGDTLSAIALKTDVSVEEIQQLNPEIDVQALQPGQRLRLRR